MEQNSKTHSNVTGGNAMGLIPLEKTLAMLTPLLEKQTYKPGLYIIPTPIGNMGDISLRALYLFSKLSVLYAEDARHTGKLLERYGLHVPLNAYHEHNDHYKTDEIVARIKRGERVGLVSDAGMPLISDPGHPLVAACLEEKLSVVVLPGPSAALTALVGSGLPSHAFTFLGFLPPKEAAREEKLKLHQAGEPTLILYESAERLPQTLKTIRSILGERRIVVARELTKQFEERIHFSSGDIERVLEDGTLTLKGEMVILVEGNQKHEEGDIIETGTFDSAILKTLSFLSLKDTATLLSSLYDLPKHALYERGLILKNEKKHS